MRSRSIRFTGAAAALVVFLSACSGGPTGTNEGDQLTDVEIQALLNELSGSFAGAGVGVPTLSSVAASDFPVLNASSAVPIDASFSESFPCQEGTLSIAGSISGDLDQETLQGSMSVGFTWDFEDCVVPTETTTFTVNGDPQIDYEGDFVFGETEMSISGSQQGGFSFTSSDGRVGRCAIDLTFEASVSREGQGQTISSTVSGSICGKSAESFDPVGV